MKKVIVAVIAVAVLTAVGIAFANRNDGTSNNSSADLQNGTSQTNQSTDDTSAGTNENVPADTNTSNEDQDSVTTITYTSSGFSPSTVTVKAGSTIKVINNSGRTIEFSSDPHPSHTDNPELNMEELAPGDSGTITVNDTGTWGYHDHLRNSETGTIIVQ